MQKPAVQVRKRAKTRMTKRQRQVGRHERKTNHNIAFLHRLRDNIPWRLLHLCLYVDNPHVFNSRTFLAMRKIHHFHIFNFLITPLYTKINIYRNNMSLSIQTFPGSWMNLLSQFTLYINITKPLYLHSHCNFQYFSTE